MANKEKVNFIRSNDFESVDEELTAALNQLENANERIVQLLESQTRGPGPETDSPEMQTHFAELGEEEEKEPASTSPENNQKPAS